MERAMARQAEAERERRAKIINAEGEFQAAAKLTDAANVMSRNPVTIQLRYLQTLLEMGSNQSSTIVFPLPLDLLQPLLKVIKPGDAPPADGGEESGRSALEAGPDPGALRQSEPREGTELPRS